MSNFSFNIEFKKFVEPELQKYPDKLVLHLLARVPDAKRVTSRITFNMNAAVKLSLLHGTEISFANDNDTGDIYLFVNNNKSVVDCPIYSLNKSLLFSNKSIYDYIITKFNLNPEEDWYIEMIESSVPLIDETPITCYKLTTVLGERHREGSLNETLEKAAIN